MGVKLVCYIWKLDPPPDSPFHGRWQYSDGERMSGGGRDEKECWEQLYHELRIQRQHGHEVDSVEIVLTEPAPVSETGG